MAPKRIMVVFRHSRQGSARATEMLELAAMAAAFGQEVHLAFLDDGVFLLTPDRTTDGVDGGTLPDALRDPAGYDIEQLWAARDALVERGLDATRLTGDAIAADAATLARAMAGMDVIVTA